MLFFNSYNSISKSNADRPNLPSESYIKLSEEAPPRLSEMHVVNFTGNYSESMAILSLEGIVNRNGPKIFYIRDDNDKFWCDYIINRLQPISLYYYNNLTSLISTFKNYINGSIVYNPENLHTRNIAVPFCGLENAILLDPDLADLFSDIYNITIINEYDFSEKWASDEDPLKMYEWAYEHYLIEDKFNSNCLALQGVENEELIDLLVQECIYTLWNINTVESEEDALKFFLKVMDYFPKNTPILGYPYATGENEGKTVRLISEAGLYLVASDFSSNLAFCSRLDFGTTSYDQNRNWDSNPPEIDKKAYITFIISDGDNLQYIENRMLEIWSQKGSNDDIPVGWSISPLAIKYAPHLVDFFYTNATESDYFVAGPSGAGYIYPDPMELSDYEGFLETSEKYMDKMDLNEIWALGMSDPEKFSKTAELTNIKGIFDGYTEKLWDDVRLTTNDVPIFTMFKYGTEAKELNDWLEDMLNLNSWRLPLFIPVWVHCWTQDYKFIEEVVEYCQERDLPVKFVRPDQFLYLYGKYREKTPISWDRLVGIGTVILLLALSCHLIKKGKTKPKEVKNT